MVLVVDQVTVRSMLSISMVAMVDMSGPLKRSQMLQNRFAKELLRR
jgi:hypothetical protein